MHRPAGQGSWSEDVPGSGSNLPRPMRRKSYRRWSFRRRRLQRRLGLRAYLGRPVLDTRGQPMPVRLRRATRRSNSRTLRSVSLQPRVRRKSRAAEDRFPITRHRVCSRTQHPCSQDGSFGGFSGRSSWASSSGFGSGRVTGDAGTTRTTMSPRAPAVGVAAELEGIGRRVGVAAHTEERAPWVIGGRTPGSPKTCQTR